MGIQRTCAFLCLEIMLLKHVRKAFKNNQEQICVLRERISLLRYSFAVSLLHDIRRGNIDWASLVKHLKGDLMTYICFIPNCLILLKNKYVSRNKKYSDEFAKIG